MDHKPSVIAAAATLVALDQQLPIEAVQLKISSIPQHRFLEPVSSACIFLISTKKLMLRRVLLTNWSGSNFDIFVFLHRKMYLRATI